jgi:uncharacterized protein
MTIRDAREKRSKRRLRAESREQRAESRIVRISRYTLNVRIGLLSDTHGFMGADILEALAGVDEIWHAGDLGSLEIVSTLEKIAPVVAVIGNIDSHATFSSIPEEQVFNREGFKVLIRHIVGTPGRYDPIARASIAAERPDILVCGHSHILRIERDAQGILYMNPGACGHHGTHQKRTLVRFNLEKKKIFGAEVVDLGARGRKKSERP